MDVKDVAVSFGSAVVMLQPSDYSDLLRQVRNSIPGLPPRIELHSDGFKINSDSAFNRLKNSLITIKDSTKHTNRPKSKPKPGLITSVPRVRLSNLAYINQQKSLNANSEEVSEVVPEEMRCPVCMERLRKPMKAKCGHVLCEECWDQTLAHLLECPLCRAHVRKKTLRPL